MRFLILVSAVLFATSARAQATLTASPTIVAPGGTVTAAWTGIASPSSVWIGLFTPTASDSSYLSWRWATDTSSGSVPFTIPSGLALGTYQLRIFSGAKQATSNNFSVARTIAGNVTLSGSPLSGVSFAATGGGTCTQSDGAGNYICGVSQGWSGSITPSLGAHGFSPASRNYSNVTTNQTAQNYTAFAPFDLSGTVSWNSLPLAGVTMTATTGGICTQSDGSGQYTCSVPPGWSGDVTPSLANYIFSPVSRSYANVSANQTAQDYAATVLRHVSGTAKVNGLPVANVAFAASTGGSCTSSNSAGQYSCTVPDGWTGTVTPSHMGYSFTPASRNYTSIAADALAEDYTATPSSPTSNISFVHVDHLNTPRLVANAAGQTVWLWHQAEPFGNNVPDENPSGLGMFDLPLRFAGQRYDAETARHYNYYRNYDPSIGRYEESDPIGLRGGLNTYAYVGGDPLLGTDPLGLAKYCCRYLSSLAGDVSGFGLGFRHCYVVADDGTVYGLYPEMVDGKTKGIPRTNDPRDVGGDCFDCPALQCGPDQNSCLRNAHNGYPRGTYRAFPGPNSNTYSATLARGCCQGGVPSGVRDAPGHWSSPPR